MSASGDNGAPKPIVVGVDASRYSREALRWAVDEAAKRGTWVRALMVWHGESLVSGARPTMIGVAAPVPGDPVESFRTALRRTIDAVRDERGDDAGDVRIEAELVRGGPPEVLVLASMEAQLLVLGSHGHGRLLEALLGSVARHCVRYARCPVVVIPARLADDRARETGEAEPVAGVPEPLGYAFGPLL